MLPEPLNPPYPDHCREAKQDSFRADADALHLVSTTAPDELRPGIVRGTRESSALGFQLLEDWDPGRDLSDGGVALWAAG